MQILPWLLSLIANWALLFRMLLFPVIEQSIHITRNVRLLLSAPILILPGHRLSQHLRSRIILQRIPCKQAPPPEYSLIFLATTLHLRIIVSIIWDSPPGHSINFPTMQMKWACHESMGEYISGVRISRAWTRVTKWVRM